MPHAIASHPVIANPLSKQCQHFELSMYTCTCAYSMVIHSRHDFRVLASLLNRWTQRDAKIYMVHIHVHVDTQAHIPSTVIISPMHERVRHFSFNTEDIGTCIAITNPHSLTGNNHTHTWAVGGWGPKVWVSCGERGESLRGEVTKPSSPTAPAGGTPYVAWHTEKQQC